MNVIDLLIDLDCLLTGETAELVREKASHKQQTVEDFLDSPEYYLSDGGYSRVWFLIDSADGTYFHLTGNSSDKAKANWQRPDVVKIKTELILRIQKWVDAQ